MTEEVVTNSESRERLIETDWKESVRRLWEVVAELLFYSTAGDKTVELKGCSGLL